MSIRADRDFAAEARHLLGELRHNKHSLNQIWGASTHRFLPNPPIPEDEIQEHELRYGIRLPSDYRTYLLEVGNGGAGPGQGLLPLGEAIRQSLAGCPDCLARPFPHGMDSPRSHAQRWFQFRDPGAPGYVPITTDEAMAPEFMSGSLVIAHGKPIKGGAVAYRLVVSGDQYGRVWRDDRARSASVGPCASASRSLTEVHFREWMLTWLEDSMLAQQFCL